MLGRFNRIFVAVWTQTWDVHTLSDGAWSGLFESGLVGFVMARTRLVGFVVATVGVWVGVGWMCGWGWAWGGHGGWGWGGWMGGVGLGLVGLFSLLLQYNVILVAFCMYFPVPFNTL